MTLVDDDPVVLEPITAVLHLAFNAGEDDTVEVEVVDARGRPARFVPDSAAATISLPGRTVPLHTWSPTNGGMTVADQRAQPGVLWLHVTGEQSAAWIRAWADARWQLDVVDLGGQERRPCAGRVRVRSGVRPGEGRSC